MSEDRYVPVGLAWKAAGDSLPTLNREQAGEAAKRLWRAFAMLSECAASVTHAGKFDGDVRRVWIARDLAVAQSSFKGWRRLVHDVSHDVHRYRHPGLTPHHISHAKLEREMVEYVIGTGLLAHIAKLAQPKPRLSTDERRKRELARVMIRLRHWESRLRRAENAVERLVRRRVVLQRRIDEAHAAQTLDNFVGCAWEQAEAQHAAMVVKLREAQK